MAAAACTWAAPSIWATFPAARPPEYFITTATRPATVPSRASVAPIHRLSGNESFSCVSVTVSPDRAALTMTASRVRENSEVSRPGFAGSEGNDVGAVMTVSVSDGGMEGLLRGRGEWESPVPTQVRSIERVPLRLDARAGLHRQLRGTDALGAAARAVHLA